MQTTWDDAPDVYEAASPILRITADAPDFFVIHGELDTPRRRRPGAAVRREAATHVEEAPSCTPSCPAPSTPSTSSTRSAAATPSAAVDRYLTWHWNTWRHGLEADSGVEPES